MPVFQSSKFGSETVLVRRPVAVHLKQPDDPIGIRVGKRPQQHAVDDAEDRRGGADAEAEREDGDEGEALGPDEHADAVAQVAAGSPRAAPGGYSSRVLLLEVLDAAEPDERLASRFLGRQARARMYFSVCWSM